MDCEKDCPAYPVCFSKKAGERCRKVLENLEKLSGNKTPEPAEDSVLQQRVDTLCTALVNVLVAAGVYNEKVKVTGPEIISAAEDYINFLKEEKTKK